jgi:GntR family transcriptional repressor for pyruvate dehydrogenase complex
MTHGIGAGTLQPIKRQKVAEQVLERLSGLIQAGTWQSGQKLPSEKELGESLRVGRSSLREAVKSLEFMGLVEVRPGQGTFVTKDSSSAVGAAVARAVTLTPQDALDLIEARELIEARIARLAAQRISAEGLRELRKYWESMEQELALGRLDPHATADLQFHTTLAEASGSRVLLRIFLTIRELLHELITQALTLPGTPQAANYAHKQILEAVERKDPAAAEEAMHTHLEDIRSRMKGILASASVDPGTTVSGVQHQANSR